MADRPDPAREVLDAMAAAGCAPRDPSVVVFDGRLHRYDVEGDRKGRKNGWFVLHDGLTPAGGFGSWKTGETRTWIGSGADALTPEQRRGARARIEVAKAQRLEEQKRLHAQARARAAALWARARATADAAHPYLSKKQVPALGLRQLGPLLLVPVADDGGVLRSLQFISAEGEKRFLAGGEVEGHAHLLGDPAAARALLLCEGYATGASLHEACGLPVAVCFNRANLFPAAKNLRRRFPDAALIVAGDDDRHTPGNPGRRDAEETARWVGGATVLPDFAGLDTSKRPTDFNDVRVLGGLDHLKRQLEEKLAAALPPEGVRAHAPPRPAGPGRRDGGREREPAARRAPGASLALTDEPVLAMAAPGERRVTPRAETRPDLYREVTDKIAALLEQGVAPWRPAWSRGRPSGAPAGPFNAATGQPYRGVNVLLLESDPRTADDPRWCGFQQAKRQGWQVKAGERGTAVYFFKRVGADDPETGNGGEGEGAAERRGFAILRRHTVFHASQIEGVPALTEAAAEGCPTRAWEAEARLETILRRTGARIVTGGERACYNPREDTVELPDRARFTDADAYYAVAFHELGHWTGHETRLNRPLPRRSMPTEYAREELRAEMASAFLGAELGIGRELGQHAAYLQLFLDLLRLDSREIFRAARDAQAIADLILDRHPTLRLQNGVCVARAGPPSEAVLQAAAGATEAAGAAPEPERRDATEPAAGGPDGSRGAAAVRLLQIISPRFCAGLILQESRVIEAAPILRRLVGLTETEVRRAAERRGWTCEAVAETGQAEAGPVAPDRSGPALPAPYRWALGALTDPDAGFRDDPLDRSRLAVAPVERRPSPMPSHPHIGGLPS